MEEKVEKKIEETMELEFSDISEEAYYEEVEEDDPLNAMVPAKKSMVLFFVIDVSTSMRGEKINAMNQAMREVLPELIGVGGSNTEIKIAVLAFSSGFEWCTPEPVILEEYQSWPLLQAEGVTDLGAALLELNEKMSRGAFLQSPTLSYAPVIFLVTDGYPTDNYKKGIETIWQNKWFKHGIKIALAIGSGVDKGVLEEFTGDSEFVVEACNVKSLLSLVKAISVTSSQIGSSSMPIVEFDKEIEEEDVEYLKQEQMKKAISEMKTDIMLVSDGSDIVFDAGW